MPTTFEEQKAPDNESKLTFEVPDRVKMNFLSFTPADKYFTVIMGIIAATAGFTHGRLAALAMVCVWIGLMLRPENGRVYYQFIQACDSLRLRANKVIWQAMPERSRSKWRRRRRRKENVIPFTTADINDRIGFIAYGKSDVIVIRGSGSNIVAEQEWEQFQTSLRKADVIKRVASSVPGRKIAVAFVFRRRPPNVQHIANKSGENLHPSIAVPEALLIPEEKWTARQRADHTAYTMWVDSQNLMAEIAGDVTMAMVITIHRESKLARAMKKRSLAEREIKRLAISRVARTAEEGLRACGVTDAHVLNLEELNLYVRSAWDVASIDEYHERMQKQWGGPEGLARSKFHWPQEKMVVHFDHCVTDSTRHAILRVREGPRKVRANFYRQLHAINVPWLTIALVSETVSSTAEYRVLNKIIPLRDTFDQVRGLVRKAPHQRKKEEDRNKREEDLFYSRFGQAYTLLIGVARPLLADTEESEEVTEELMARLEEEGLADLEDDAMQVIQTTYQLGMSVSRITTEARQFPGLWSATMGIPML